MKRSRFGILAGMLLVAAACMGCVENEPSLGKDLLDQKLLYDTYTVDYDLTDIRLQKPDALAGYSSTRLTIGAIRDEVFGLTTRASAFTLIPARDTIDFGQDPVAVKFDVHFAPDSISVADPSQARILQNVRVYELTDTLRTVGVGTNSDIPHSANTVTRGIPVLNGSDSLSFELSQELAQRYVDGIRRLAYRDSILIQRTEEHRDTVPLRDYLHLLPGLYVTTDAPEGIGGRINMFVLSSLTVSSNRYIRNGNVGLLTVNAGYPDASGKVVRKDTTFLFYPGEPAWYDETAYVTQNTMFYQYAYNQTTHEDRAADPAEGLLVEGGGGLKPVIRAEELQRLALDAITRRGGTPQAAVINKASIILPYDQPDDDTLVDLFPPRLSPTICTVQDGIPQFRGLTDASASDENQGDLDRSNLQYAPDITYHLQQILTTENLDTETNRDIWLLTMHTEVTEATSGSTYDSDYYQQMMYAMYYNSLYGGGYNGYSGYSGYSGYNSYGYNSYTNYYNYLMLAQMMASANQSTTSVSQELDKDRYYCARLNGANSTSTDPLTGRRRTPRLRITFSLPRG